MPFYIPYTMIERNNSNKSGISIDYTKTPCPVELKRFLECFKADVPNNETCKKIYNNYIKCINLYTTKRVEK